MPEESERLSRTDREILVELRRDVRYMREKMDNQHEDSKEQLRDHEARLRTLEHFRWWFLGGVVASGGLASVIARILK